MFALRKYSSEKAKLNFCLNIPSRRKIAYLDPFENLGLLRLSPQDKIRLTCFCEV